MTRTFANDLVWPLDVLVSHEKILVKHTILYVLIFIDDGERMLQTGLIRAHFAKEVLLLCLPEDLYISRSSMKGYIHIPQARSNARWSQVYLDSSAKHIFGPAL